MRCAACQQGQSRTESEQLWHCQQCVDGMQYVISENDKNTTCMPCPIGLICSDGGVKERLNGSKWEKDVTAGVYRLQSCPSHYQVIVGSSDGAQQECQQCGKGKECTNHTCKECSDCTPGNSRTSSVITVTILFDVNI